MPISTDQYSIKALFDQKQTFSVPKYQRGYAWEDEALDDFITDLKRCLISRIAGNPKPHFFGGVVTIRREAADSTRDNYEIVDGQQRLASFVILIGCVLRHLKKELKKLKHATLDEEGEKARLYLKENSKNLKMLYLKFRDNKGIEYQDVNKLSLSKADNEYFQEVINYLGEPAHKRESHKRILDARSKLNDFVADSFFHADLSSPERAIRLQKFTDEVLGKDCTAIFMCSDDRSEAYQIFQVLNDRGVHLSQGDLLRARTLELLDGEQHELAQDQVAEEWDRILSYTPRQIDNYLMWYFSSMEGRRPKPKGLADEFLEHRFKCMGKEAASASDAKQILEEAKCMSENFSTLASMDRGEWPFEYHSKITTWDRQRLRILVSDLQHTNAMPLMLSLTLLDPPRFAEAITSIERFVFRYKTIVNAHTTPMTRVYLQHAKSVRDADNYKLTSLRQDLEELIENRASNTIFETALRERKFVPKGNNRYLRYFFLTIEDYAKWYDSGAQGVPKCRDKSRVFDIDQTTIDHIYPQNPLEGNEVDELEGVKHEIGNLTILSPYDNNSLQNAPFEQKSEAFEQSSLGLNRTIATNGTWNRTNFNLRSNVLVKMAMKIFVP